MRPRYANISRRGCESGRVGQAAKRRGGRKKTAFLQKESPVPGDSARKRSSWRNKRLKEKPYEPSGGGRAAGAARRLACAATADPARRLRAGGHRLHVLRGPVLPAPGDGPQAQDEGGPGRGSRRPAAATRTASTLVRDNLNTPGAFYEASCAGAGVGQASRCAPKHGSWLDIAENELRIRQYPRHRDVNERVSAAWTGKVDDARCKSSRCRATARKRRTKADRAGEAPVRPMRKIFFGSVVGVRIRRGEARQGIAYLDRDFIAEIAGFRPRVLPVVFDLDQPRDAVGQANKVSGFRSSGDALVRDNLKRKTRRERSTKRPARAREREITA